MFPASPPDLIGLVLSAGAWWIRVRGEVEGPFGDLERAFARYLEVAPAAVETPWRTRVAPPSWWNHSVRRWMG